MGKEIFFTSCEGGLLIQQTRSDHWSNEFARTQLLTVCSFFTIETIKFWNSVLHCVFLHASYL